MLIDEIRIDHSCCSDDPDCYDGNPCTTDVCPGLNSFCVFEEVPGCCLADTWCDDEDDCTVNVCTDEHVCSFVNICCEGDGDCDDEDDLCTEDTCVVGMCQFEPTGADGCCNQPLIADDFSEDLGWEYDQEWERGEATPSSCSVAGGEDPHVDHTGSSDDFVAGVVLGGCTSVAQLHPYRYLTSPAVYAAGAPALYLSYWRWLNSDYAPYMDNNVQIYDGLSWNTVWESGPSPGIEDEQWTYVVHDISEYAADGLRVRFGFRIDSNGVFSSSSWNLDDVRIYSSEELMCCQYDTDCEGLGNDCVGGGCQ